MAARTLGVLGRPGLANWRYNPRFLGEIPKGAYRALLDPNSMNDFQATRAEDGYVSTPSDGLLAGVTNRGRVSALFAPHTGFTDQIPYHVDDPDDLLKGSKPRDGAFFGIRRGTDDGSSAPEPPTVEWLWEADFDHELRPVAGTGMLELRTTRRRTPGRLRRAADRAGETVRRGKRGSDVEGRQGERGSDVDVELELTETTYVVPETEVLARDLHVRNVGTAPVEAVYYYTQANANAELQYPPGITSPNRVTASVGTSDAASVGTSEATSEELSEATSAGTSASDGAIDGAIDGTFDGAVDGTVDGGVDGAIDGAGDGAIDGAGDGAVGGKVDGGGELRWSDTASDRVVRVFPEADVPVRSAGVADAPLERLFEVATPSTEGHYVGGFLELDVTVAPGEETTVTVYTTGRSDGTAVNPTTSALAGDARSRQAAARDWWGDLVAAIDTDGVPKRHVPQFVASTIAVANLYDPSSGSISAAPHVQPAYYPSWPRDGGISAVALARAGLPGIAADFLGRFLPAVQGADGSFAQCYASNGEPAGVIPVENDQQPVFAWAVAETHAALSSADSEDADAFLDRAWPAVAAALDYTVGALADNDLLEATHDYAEMWTDADQSLWTNAYAYRGLLDGAALARRLGEPAAEERYRTAADRIGDAIEAEFFGVDAPAGRLSSGAKPEAGWSPAGRFASHLTLTGPEQRPTTMNAVALWPTRWADDYGYRADLLPALADAYEHTPTRWLPKEFAYAAALYRIGDANATDAADAVLADLADAVTDGGTFAEEVEADGTQNFAALGWSNAAFVLALDERRRASA